MRFLALQTDIGLLKKQFIPEGENEILTVTRHFMKFFTEFFGMTSFALLITTTLSFGVQFLIGTLEPILVYGFIAIIFVFYAYQIVKSYIAWRYNFLIVTSEKLIIIHHESFLHEYVNTIHLDNIRSTRFESQFFGIFRCGILSIDLLELAGGSTQVLVLSYIPAPDTIASAIEHAIALKQQKQEGTDTPQEQEQKAEEIKEELEKEAENPPKSDESPQETKPEESSPPVNP